MSLLIKETSCRRVHFVGIFGSGMSALAQYLRWAELEVSGSDRLINNPSTESVQSKLTALGCSIHNQDGSGISPQTDCLVVSTAIEDSNPDIARAKELSLPIYHRSDVLAALVSQKKSIAIAGTSGKSTVTALIFHLLSQCGKRPSLITGAGLNELSKNGLLGNAYYDSGEFLVFEADESDGTLVKYAPYVSAFLNVSKDHKPIAETCSLFKTLADQSSHIFIANDDQRIRSLDSKTDRRTFGLTTSADFAPDTFENTKGSVSLSQRGYTFSLPYPGRYMIENLNAALAVCSFLGCSDVDLAKAAPQYQGIARRFDVTQTKKGISVIDDFAHNPEKLKAAIETAQSLSDSIIALFQPHGFGPTKFLFDELVALFKDILREKDRLLLLPIYYAGGSADRDVSSVKLAEQIDPCQRKVYAPTEREEALTLIKEIVTPEDVIISMGARDPSLPAFAQSIVRTIDS